MNNPISYNVGEKVKLTAKSLARINTSNRCTGVQYFSEEFKQKLSAYVGQLATVTHRFPPGYEMTIEFADGQAFHSKDNWIEPVNSYEVTLVLSSGKKKFTLQAVDMYAAIENAKKEHGGGHLLTVETVESQARH